MLSLGRGKQPLRIGYGRVFHEVNAFSPSRTTLADFERMHLLRGADLAAATGLGGTELKSFMPHAELTGFRQAARLAGNVTPVPLLSAFAVPGGLLTQDAFFHLLNALLEALAQAGPLDAVYLALHGSMQVEDLPQAPEAVILRRVREVVGPKAKIAVSYDLHANLTAGMVDPVDILIAFRANPHWDLAPTGFRAGKRLIRTLRGELRPVHAWRKLPMLFGGGLMVDFLPPMRGVFRYMKALERDPRVISASLFMVHPYTTAEHPGWAVHVCTHEDRALAEQLAEELADRVWQCRTVPHPPLRTVDEALDEVKRSPWRKLGPITLIDVDDIVGAGAPGGNTRIIEGLLRRGRGLRAFVPLHDPAAVNALVDQPVGARVEVTLRGTPGYGSPAVPVTATIAAHTTTDSGRTLRLDIEDFHVVISEQAPLPIHPSFWSQVGLRSRDADLIVQKNFFHYRMFYLTQSFQHIPVVSGGATSLQNFMQRQYEVPMYPQSQVEHWREHDPLLRRLAQPHVS